MFDPEEFGRAMGEAILKAVQPLQREIAELKAKLAGKPDLAKLIADEVIAQVAKIAPAKDGKDCDMEAVKALIDAAVKAIPVINGKDGADGKDGKDGVGKDGAPGEPGRDGASVTAKEVEEMVKAEAKSLFDSLPAPKDGAPGADGKDGEKGADGLGLAGAMIDREGSLMVTLSNGEVKDLGPVVGKNGTDGKDGVGLDSFELEYIPETHEIAIKAAAAGRVKELRYPAGGIRPAGYWRDGTKAKASEAWVHDGSLWIATKDTSAKPESANADWVIAARRGRDGERGQKGLDGSPPAPIKLGA